MTDDQTRKLIRIAQAHGWKLSQETGFGGVHTYITSPDGTRKDLGRGIPTTLQFEDIPDRLPKYYSDLNAIRKAVLCQSQEFQDSFDFALRRTGKRLADLSAGTWCEVFCELSP